ncbi:MAG: GyrI-like domain-containing protein [Gammaproteobacteria bacterium]|nr:GyrI-like domain-containing protein [Gammaproteobacteria bacterium]
MQECKIIERKTQAVLYIRGNSAAKDLPDFFHKAYGSIAQHAQQEGIQFSGAPYAAYYNMDMENLDVEAGFPVLLTETDKENIHTGEIPAGRYATTIHTGPYSQVEPSYNTLMQYMQENGVESTGIVYEFYLNDPDTTPPDQLQTQILFLLK